MIRRLLAALLALPALAALTLWLWPAAELPPAPPGRYLDLHAHAAGIGAGGSGCFVSAELAGSYKLGFYLRAFGVTIEELERAGDDLLLARLAERLAGSRRVGKAVVLALDGVYDEAGELDRARTQVYVPDEYLGPALRRYPNLLFGASVNPHRRDWRAALDRAVADGAVLIKWIPAIMAIRPDDPRLVPFYDRLRELGLPLLTHTGSERSFAAADDRLGDPRRLHLALERGVTVIAAHLGAGGHNDGREDFERLVEMLERYPNLYADISALTQINHLGYLRRALARPAIESRLLYGSDWPLQLFPLVSPWYQLPHISPGIAKAIAAIANPWDRDVALKEALGVPASLLGRGAALLGVDP